MIRLGLTGWPVSHSLSPVLHNTALRESGLEGEYILYPSDPSDPESLPALMSRLRTGELNGLNITIPHKQAVTGLLDGLTASAMAIGAVNTIYLQDGRLMGDNTDAPGFLADLRNKFFQNDQHWKSTLSGQALVLGAGGSARAIVWALAGAGWPVLVASRRPEQAAELADSLKRANGSLNIMAINLSDTGVSGIQKEFNLVVNTTSAGMTPNVSISAWPETIPLPAHAYLYDLVYNPRETLLVRQARAAGLKAVTGIGMLVEQAALGFEIWTGHTAPRMKMTLAVEA